MTFDHIIGFLVGILVMVLALALLPFFLSIKLFKKLNMRFIKIIYYFWLNDE